MNLLNREFGSSRGRLIVRSENVLSLSLRLGLPNYPGYTYQISNCLGRAWPRPCVKYVAEESPLPPCFVKFLSLNLLHLPLLFCTAAKPR